MRFVFSVSSPRPLYYTNDEAMDVIMFRDLYLRLYRIQVNDDSNLMASVAMATFFLGTQCHGDSGVVLERTCADVVQCPRTLNRRMSIWPHGVGMS